MDSLPSWMSAFPDTTHVIFLRELVEDDAALERLWQALGVDPGAAPERSGDAVNQTDGAAPALSRQLSGTFEAYFEASNRALSAHLGRPHLW